MFPTPKSPKRTELGGKPIEAQASTRASTPVFHVGSRWVQWERMDVPVKQRPRPPRPQAALKGVLGSNLKELNMDEDLITMSYGEQQLLKLVSGSAWLSRPKLPCQVSVSPRLTRNRTPHKASKSLERDEDREKKRSVDLLFACLYHLVSSQWLRGGGCCGNHHERGKPPSVWSSENKTGHPRFSEGPLSLPLPPWMIPGHVFGFGKCFV